VHRGDERLEVDPGVDDALQGFSFVAGEPRDRVGLARHPTSDGDRTVLDLDGEAFLAHAELVARAVFPGDSVEIMECMPMPT